MYECKIIADSISQRGHRLTTMQITYPRFVHSEFMTHRMFSRNAASSRAIPIKKMIQAVVEDPVLPVYWGKNQTGMQAREELEGLDRKQAMDRWLIARDDAVLQVQLLDNIGLHKQIANRILEPWMWITVVVTATEWDNFFNLRCHPDAQPELRKIAEIMRDAYQTNTPERTVTHLPYVSTEEAATMSMDQPIMCSVARCARVSYTKQDERKGVEADITLCTTLRESGHWSPFEHVAFDSSDDNFYANFRGWESYRHVIES